MSNPPAFAEAFTGAPLDYKPLVGAVGHSRLSMQAASWVSSSLQGCAPGERVTWDVAVQLVPTPQGPRPMVLIYLATPSAVLGEQCGEVVLVEPQHLTEDAVDRNVRSAVERILSARSESAARPGRA